MLNNSFVPLSQAVDGDDRNLSQKLDLISRHSITYIGLFFIVFGNVNSILVILFFTLYKSFRQNTCSNYLLLCSICDLLQLDFGYIIRYLNDSLFQYDLTAKSLVWCKFRFFLTQMTIMCSFTALLLASVDRYIHTSDTYHWMKNFLLERTRLIIASLILLCAFLASPSLYYITIDSNRCYALTGSWYFYYMHIFFLLLCLIIPITLMSLFSYLTIRNLNHTINQSPRMKLNKRIRQFQLQVTYMLLIQVFFTVLSTLPYAICIIYETITSKWYKTAKQRAIESFVSSQLRLLLNTYSCDNLYTYLIVSPTFRAKIVSHVIYCHFRRQQNSEQEVTPV